MCVYIPVFCFMFLTEQLQEPEAEVQAGGEGRNLIFSNWNLILMLLQRKYVEETA